MSETQFEEVVALAMELTPLEKTRLIERIASTLQHALFTDQPGGAAPSLYGLWADLDINISEDDIAAIRNEMWVGFPREDT